MVRPGAICFREADRSMKVYLLIPTKNRKDLAVKCLASLKKQTCRNFDIVFIDDGSTDETAKALRKIDSEVIILRGDGNLWWCGSVRMGVDYILNLSKPGDFIVIQNDDTYMQPDYLQVLMDESVRHGRMVLGTPNVDFESNQLIYNSHRIGKLGAIGPAIVISSEDILETDTLSGRGAIIPIEVFGVTGNFSKLFPHYAADYDFFFRAKRAGFKVAVTTKVITYSTSLQPNLSRRIKSKKPPTFRDMIDLFFDRRSSDNLWATILVTFLHSPWPYKLFGIGRRFLFVLKFLFYDYLLGNLWAVVKQSA